MPRPFPKLQEGASLRPCIQEGRFAMEQLDKVAGPARITAMAEQAFRDPARASRWLRKPKKRFDGKSPLEMLATEAGARLVEEMILQFEYGMTA